MSRRVTNQIERLRQFRALPGGNWGLGHALRKSFDDLASKQRKLGTLGLAWAEVMPQPLRDRVEPLGVTRGVLSIRAADTATRFELDRFLRSGGLDALRARARSSFKQVKIQLGPPAEGPRDHKRPRR